MTHVRILNPQFVSNYLLSVLEEEFQNQALFWCGFDKNVVAYFFGPLRVWRMVGPLVFYLLQINCWVSKKKLKIDQVLMWLWQEFGGVLCWTTLYLIPADSLATYGDI